MTLPIPSFRLLRRQFGHQARLQEGLHGHSQRVHHPELAQVAHKAGRGVQVRLLHLFVELLATSVHLIWTGLALQQGLLLLLVRVGHKGRIGVDARAVDLVQGGLVEKQGRRILQKLVELQVLGRRDLARNFWRLRSWRQGWFGLRLLGGLGTSCLLGIIIAVQKVDHSAVVLRGSRSLGLARGGRGLGRDRRRGLLDHLVGLTHRVRRDQTWRLWLHWLLEGSLLELHLIALL